MVLPRVFNENPWEALLPIETLKGAYDDTRSERNGALYPPKDGDEGCSTVSPFPGNIPAGRIATVGEKGMIETIITIVSYGIAGFSLMMASFIIMNGIYLSSKQSWTEIKEDLMEVYKIFAFISFCCIIIAIVLL